MTQPNSYRFSFTAASLMVTETALLAQRMAREGIGLNELLPDMLGLERQATGKRKFAEVRLRLQHLHPNELRYLAEAPFEEQRLLCLLAFARAYTFFRDFVLEVLVDKVRRFDFQLEEVDYNAFVFRKAIDYEELENLADSTRKKVKQVVFKVLEQGGLINSTQFRTLRVPLMNPALEQLIAAHNPNDLNLLLLTPEHRMHA